MRAVLDTNIIISGLNFAGRERELLDLARASAYELYLSPFILAEVSSVLTRTFGWEAQRTRRTVDLLSSWATIIEPATRISVIERNDADNRILECAVESEADYFVTGDRRDLLPIGEFEGVRIVTSAVFMSTFDAS